MNLLIRKAKVIDPQSSFHLQQVDLHIKNGKIAAIGKDIKAEKAKVVEGDNIHVSIGWFDFYASMGDPGFEYKEDLQSGTEAAAVGGFTGVAVKPDTHPTIQSKGEIEYIFNKTKDSIVDLYPIGALSHNREGKDITEMYDMNEAGAIAFSDGDRPIENAGLLLRSLQYVKPFNGLIINRPANTSIANGVINEGKMSVNLGMKGSPAIAEELMVHRDLYLSEYAASKLHFVKVSTKGAIQLIRDAKKRGLNISASVSSYHLLLNEEMLEEFDSNYKVKPPLRTNEDIKSLIKGLQDGTIDIICSDHNPQNEESKKMEFEYADFGIINLETSFAVLNTALKSKIGIEQIVEKIAVNPRQILNLEVPVIKEGAKANLTIFDPEKEWVVQEQDLRSKSRNTPFINRKLTGKVIGIINNNKYSL